MNFICLTDWQTTFIENHVKNRHMFILQLYYEPDTALAWRQDFPTMSQYWQTSVILSKSCDKHLPASHTTGLPILPAYPHYLPTHTSFLYSLLSFPHFYPIPTTYQPSQPAYPHYLPTHTTCLPSLSPYAQYLPISTTYLPLVNATETDSYYFFILVIRRYLRLQEVYKQTNLNEVFQ